MLKRAGCGSCGRSLPLGPGILKFRFPPRQIQCRHCQTLMNTSFAYRATWLQSLLWKTLTVLGALVCLASAIADQRSMPEILGITLVGGVLMGFLGGFIAAIIAAPPIQLVIDLFGWIVRKIRGTGGTAPPPPPRAL